jgi:hypothetical protein
MKRWKNTKNIGKHFIPDIVEAGAYMLYFDCYLDHI